MKRKSIIVVIVLIISCIGCNAQNEKEETNFPELTGLYLGQKPFGLTAEIFASGIISRNGYFEHSAAVFSPDLSEVFWSAKPDGRRYFKIYFMKMINGKWTQQQLAPFNGNKNNGKPTFSSDGKKLFFDSEGDIFFVKKEANTWTNAVKLSSAINTHASESVQSITENSSIYFLRFNPNAKIRGNAHEMFVSKVENGKYSKPEKLDKNINSIEQENAISVAPNESYMIIEETKDNRLCELYISYKMAEKKWSKRILLPIAWGRFPSVSPDEKYLFFMTRDAIYWIDAKFIVKFKKEQIKT